MTEITTANTTALSPSATPIPPQITEPRGSTQTYQPTTTHLSYYEAGHRLHPSPPDSTPTYSTTWLTEETRGEGAETPPPKGLRKVLAAAAAAAAALRHADRCQRRDLKTANAPPPLHTKQPSLGLLLIPAPPLHGRMHRLHFINPRANSNSSRQPNGSNVMTRRPAA